MNVDSFFKLVEIQTKVASVIPYLLGTVYTLYRFDTFNLKNAILMFFSMIIFDMTVTAINNYFDYTRAIKKEGYGYESHNAIGRDNLNINTVKFVIITLLLISSVLGIILFINTDIVVLIIGAICFGIGILYSYGPLPISRTPFGEIFSGLTMGFAIAFLSIYIHMHDQHIITIDLANKNLTVLLNLDVLISLFIVTVPVICGISNIMLANNICDMEDDFENRRYTLPIIIGKERALIVYKWTYYIGFIAIIAGVLLRILPITSILVLAVFKLVNDNIKVFLKLQSKKDTFVLAVKNFVLTNILYITTIILGIFLF